MKKDAMILYIGQNRDVINEPLSNFFDDYSTQIPCVHYLFMRDMG